MDNLRQHLRSQKRLQRRTLSPHAQLAASTSLYQRILQQGYLTRYSKIACYIAHDGEINPAPILQHAWQENITCYVPHITDDKQFLFTRYQEEDSLHKHHHGFLQPQAHPKQIIAAEALELVFVPLVAFDTFCYRLGMGAGYYDKAFAFCKQDLPHKPLLVGLAYDMQQVESIPHHPWDVPLDMVLTEKTQYVRQQDPEKP